MAAKWTLPPARPVAWELKPLSSATTEFDLLGDGRLELKITHDVFKGVTPLMLKVFNSHIRPRIFSDEMARAWLQHHVEEIGNLENFLPALYAQHAQQKVRT